MSEWRIRTGGTSDVSSVLALWQAAEALPTATDSAGPLHSLLARDGGSLLLAEADGELVGSLIAGWDGWRGSFYRLAVQPEWRRRGVGTALVRTGEDRLRDLGAIRLTAIVADDEAAAMSLWEALGYSRQPDRSRFVRVLTEDRR